MRKPKYEDVESDFDFSTIIPANPGWKAVYKFGQEPEIHYEPVIAWGFKLSMSIERDVSRLDGDSETPFKRMEGVGFVMCPGLFNSIVPADRTGSAELLGYEPPDNETDYETDWEYEAGMRKEFLTQSES